MPIPINAYGNCVSDLIGSATRSCDISTFGDAIGLVLFQKQWSMDVAVANFLTAWNDDIKSMNIIPYVGIYDFTQDTPENDRATSSTGRMSIIRTGKPQYSFVYDRGGCLHKSLYNKRGNGRWDFGIMFETGLLVAQSVDGETIEGFDGGMLDVGTLQFQQGTDPQRSTATIQLLNANQFNTRFVFLTWEALGTDLTSIEGVVETNITVTDAPASGSATFDLKVTSACNSDDVILGLDEVTYWRIGGVQATPRTISAVAFDTATQSYTFTLTGNLATGDTIQPTLSTAGVDVIVDDAGVFYKGKAPLITV